MNFVSLKTVFQKMENDGFTLVKGGKKRKGKKFCRTTVIDKVNKDTINISKVVDKIRIAVEEVRSSKFFIDACTMMKKFYCENVWCFGIGHLGECVTARYQFAFLLLLKDVFKLCSKKMFICDPILYEEEMEIIKTFNCNVATENIECMLECNVPTFLFLPHCPKQLSNNLLFSNWSASALENLVICSNSFQNIIDRNSAKVLAENASFIVSVTDKNLVNEVPLMNTFKYNDVFNDLSVHSFQVPNSLPTDFWKSSKPVYEPGDTEFIRRA